ncbi:ATP synthase F1 subunit gamma [Candidatus Binatia bacterium]|jgi:F-type H+-transporting ATPase subunit gamma|nr:ATP synthase F1 subunit gamma [Candidatus Binatia bacterium]
MASLKDIRKRIGTVRSTQQITKAMKMVAAAKLRRAQAAAIAARPYAQKLDTIVTHLVRRLPDDVHPLLRVPESNQRVLLIHVTSDRGLRGGYNSNLNRALETFVQERSGLDISFEGIGRKGLDHLRRRGRPTIAQHAMPSVFEASNVARELARETVRRFVDDEFDAIFLLYSSFRSALSQVPTVEQLLPFERHAGGDDHEQTALDYVFEPSPQEIIGYLLPRLVEVRILHALLEAGASEQAAAMTAMDSATRNASQMIERLTLQMNRARQAAITKELMEIIGGAEALKG